MDHVSAGYPALNYPGKGCDTNKANCLPISRYEILCFKFCQFECKFKFKFKLNPDLNSKAAIEARSGRQIANGKWQIIAPFILTNLNDDMSILIPS